MQKLGQTDHFWISLKVFAAGKEGEDAIRNWRKEVLERPALRPGIYLDTAAGLAFIVASWTTVHWLTIRFPAPLQKIENSNAHIGTISKRRAHCPSIQKLSSKVKAAFCKRNSVWNQEQKLFGSCILPSPAALKLKLKLDRVLSTQIPYKLLKGLLKGQHPSVLLS